MTSTNVHFRAEPEPALKYDDVLVIEPIHKFGAFRVARDQIIEPLPPKIINIATDFTTDLPALVDTGSPSPLTKKITELDMQVGNLAQYYLVPIDDAVLFEIKQPGAVGRFANKEGPVRFDKGDIDFFIETGWLSMIPQVWVYSNETPVTITAISEDMDEDSFDARLKAFGWRYALEYIGKDRPIGQPYTTVRVEGLQ